MDGGLHMMEQRLFIPADPYLGLEAHMSLEEHAVKEKTLIGADKELNC